MITTRKHTSQSRLVDKCATMSASGISFSWPDQHQQQHCMVYFTDKKSFTWNSKKLPWQWMVAKNENERSHITQVATCIIKFIQIPII